MLSFLGFTNRNLAETADQKLTNLTLAAGDETLSLTHKCSDFLSLHDIANELCDLKRKLLTEHGENPIKLSELNQLLDTLAEFELGRFLIKNNALSGGWTYYVIAGYTRREIENELERFLLTKAPSILATRERFYIFQQLLLDNIKNNSVVCSIPCGLMADLTTLEIPDNVTSIKYVGIDLDMAALATANDFAKISLNANKATCEFRQRDAWDMGSICEFDIVTSNGLNIYEKDDGRVVSLYREIFKALKPGGLFIGSSLSIPPSLSSASEWRIEEICKEDLDVQRKVFVDILRASWQNFRASEESKYQLETAGFHDVTFHYDSKKIFYTFTAKKPKI